MSVTAEVKTNKRLGSISMKNYLEALMVGLNVFYLSRRGSKLNMKKTDDVIKRVLWGTVVLLCLRGEITYSASFNCSLAESNVEKMVCFNAELSALDDELAVVYKKGLASSDNPAKFKETQLLWLKYSRGGCKTEGCVKLAYMDRIMRITGESTLAERREMVKLANADRVYKNYAYRLVDLRKDINNHSLPLQFYLTYGDPYPLCQPFIDELNRQKLENFPACSRKVGRKGGEFGELDWKQAMTESKIKKIIGMVLSGEHARYGRTYDPEKLKANIEEFYKRNTRAYSAHFDFDRNGNSETIYKLEDPFTSKKEGRCGFYYLYYVDDKNYTMKNMQNTDIHAHYPYRYLFSGSDNEFFTFRGQIYSSVLAIDDFPADINVRTTKFSEFFDYGRPLCGIGIK